MAFVVPTYIQDEAAIVAPIAAAWLLLYLIMRHVVLRHRSADFCNRVVSLVHGAMGLIWPFFVLDLHRLKGDVGTPTTPEQLALLRVSFAYFFYDMFCCLAIKFDLGDLFHHVATLVGLYVGVFEKVSAHELLMCLTLMEASGPFLHMRSILRELGKGGTPLADANDLLFASTFLFCRNFLGIFVVYWTVMCPETPILVKAGGLGILGISLIWTSKLVSMISRKLKPKPKPKQRIQ